MHILSRNVKRTFYCMSWSKGLRSSAFNDIKSFSNERKQCFQNILSLGQDGAFQDPLGPITAIPFLTGHLALSSGGSVTMALDPPD